MLKENTSYKCLSLIVLESIIRVNKKYYPPTLLEKCKNEKIRNKVYNRISNDLDLSSSDELDNETENETDNGSDSDSND